MIFEETFTTAAYTLSSIVRDNARRFANKVWEEDEENSIITISGSNTVWGLEVTVWYYAKERILK